MTKNTTTTKQEIGTATGKKLDCKIGTVHKSLTTMQQNQVTTLNYSISTKDKFIQSKIIPIKIHKIGTMVQKNTKYKSSSTYFCRVSPKGQRELLSQRYSEESTSKPEGTLNTKSALWIFVY
jgi:hypothetical protein